jgi:hypothetical protein
MYYIINHTDQVVAIDPQLLSYLNVESADEFYRKMALGDITFQLDEDEVGIFIDGLPQTLKAKVSPLAGMLGDIRLVDILPPSENTTEEEKLSLDIDEEPEPAEEVAQREEEPLSLDDIDLFDTEEKVPTESPVQESETAQQTEEAPLEPEDKIDLIDIKTEVEEEILPLTETEAKTTESQTDEDDLFELILPTDADNAIAEIAPETESVQEAPSSAAETDIDADQPIYIDVAGISEKIGISTEDYNLFLNEYIDTALTFEQALQSKDDAVKDEALNTLTHLSNVLHLPFVGEILEQIKHASSTERDKAIESFFATLGRLTTAHFEEEKTPSETISEIIEEEVPEVREETPETIASEKAPIDLSDIKPIHFDFQLEEAAKDLSLPVELIEEFVNDFIEQAHEETEKMIAAYEKGDLETVQKIGHLLKGTSSNLRINPLSDTLYEIQFNEDIDRVPELVRNYWAHFLSLENQIKLISKK